MLTIKKSDYVFSVDIAQTEKYYDTHSLCDCVFCRNYYAQIKDKLPRLGAFLSEFGADISKPDEISCVEMEDYIDYLCVDYTVCGSVSAMGQKPMDICDHLPVSVTVTDGFASPNEQTGEYFTISVSKIALPWVLDEPFPRPAAEKFSLSAKSLFCRLFGR